MVSVYTSIPWQFCVFTANISKELRHRPDELLKNSLLYGDRVVWMPWEPVFTTFIMALAASNPEEKNDPVVLEYLREAERSNQQLLKTLEGIGRVGLSDVLQLNLPKTLTDAFLITARIFSQSRIGSFKLQRRNLGFL
jgi:hypothetical protein